MKQTTTTSKPCPKCGKAKSIWNMCYVCQECYEKDVEMVFNEARKQGLWP